jgi:ergothioneine biosynthesis protein EgtB
MPDASPTKWHLAHTTWFFETFVLALARPDFTPVDASYRTLFNSYYETIGPRHTRAERGLLSRPSLAEVEDYRAIVDERMREVLANEPSAEVRRRTTIGLHHEQQHQELLLTDVLHALSRNPRAPAYRPRPPLAAPASDCSRTNAAPPAFVEGTEGVVRIGHEGRGFAFDNEGPSHRVFLERHALGSRLLTNREALAFIEAGGYDDARLWLAEGFDFVRRHGLRAPLYWQRAGGEAGDEQAPWRRFSLLGERDLEAELDAPVCHVSYYEADAMARFYGGRLPTEAEWETAAKGIGEPPESACFVENEAFSPHVSAAPRGLDQLFGDVWEWTASSYLPYPGYRAEEGALGEYNGKFMVGQQVLRGGSCFSPRSHLRASYRNFFPPSARWQMSGVRVARSLP